MIQFKRGKSKTWKNTDPELLPGQPGFDVERCKLKIGTGNKAKKWSELPYVSGLSADEIFSSAKAAKEQTEKYSDYESIITYGEDAPTNSTKGKIYLQYDDSQDPQADYVTSFIERNGWTCQKWRSGYTVCWRSIQLDGLALNTKLGDTGLFTHEAAVKASNYPVTFDSIPVETASVAVDDGAKIIWLATHTSNSTTASAKYKIISYTSRDPANYTLKIHVAGLCTSS